MYTVAKSSIIHELLDNEVIIADLDSGIYFSLRETGVQIWQLILKGFNEQRILDAFTESTASVDASAIQSFIHTLEKEHLIQKHDDTTTNTQIEVELPSLFSPPLFEKYEEMKDLLMLDPIHEVDEQGWPSKA